MLALTNGLWCVNMRIEVLSSHDPKKRYMERESARVCVRMEETYGQIMKGGY